MEYRTYYDADNRHEMVDVISAQIPNMKHVDLICIGTDRATGDALGPLVGNIMSKEAENIDRLTVLGTIDNPVHAVNLKNIPIHEDHFTIAVDSGLGEESSVGAIITKDKPLKPGSGVDKELPLIGDMHITGIVNISGYMPYLVIQSTRLSIVMNMAKVMASILVCVFKKERGEMIDHES